MPQNPNRTFVIAGRRFGTLGLTKATSRPTSSAMITAIMQGSTENYGVSECGSDRMLAAIQENQ